MQGFGLAEGKGVTLGEGLQTLVRITTIRRNSTPHKVVIFHEGVDVCLQICMYIIVRSF
jgi:hypothetical protein